MKVINFQNLKNEYKTQACISPDANRLANSYIREYCIQTGFGLARFLDVDICFDNHMALRVWVQNKLDVHETYVFEEIRAQLESELYDLLGGSSITNGYL